MNDDGPDFSSSARVKPIFCARNSKPVGLNKSLSSSEEGMRYDWVVFLVSGMTVDGNNEYRCSYTITENSQDSLIASDVQGFKAEEKDDLSKFMCSPINLFKKSELDVFLFDNEKRTTDEVHRMVRAWSKNKTTNN